MQLTEIPASSWKLGSVAVYAIVLLFTKNKQTNKTIYWTNTICWNVSETIRLCTLFYSTSSCLLLFYVPCASERKLSALSSSFLCPWCWTAFDFSVQIKLQFTSLIMQFLLFVFAGIGFSEANLNMCSLWSPGFAGSALNLNDWYLHPWHMRFSLKYNSAVFNRTFVPLTK